MREAPARRGPDNAGVARARLPVLVVLFGAAYAVLGLARHVTYRSTGFDLGLFDQVVWHLGNLDAPASSVKGLGSIFGDHFSPVLVLWAPLTAAGLGPGGLVVAQAVLVAASIWPVVRYAERRLEPGPALALGAAYGLFGGVQSAVAFDVHEVAFAPLLIALAVLWEDEGRRRRAVAAVLALLLVKEDLSFLVLAFGVWFAVRGDRRTGAALAAAGLAWYALASRVLIPHFADGHAYGYWSYGKVSHRPWTVFETLVSPAVKVKTTVVLFGSFLGLSLLSPLCLLAVPLLAERLLSDHPQYWTLQAHYSLTVAPVLALAAADGLARVGAWRPQWPRRAAAVMVAIGVTSCAHFALGDLVRPSTYRTPAAARALPAALRLVPADASVAATNHVLPHVSERDDVVLLEAGARPTDYVVAQTGDPAPAALFPSPDRAALLAVLAARRRAGMRLLYDRGGVVVLGPRR